ncbi:MAG: adenosylhomocysteinase, partial [Vulcanimicrobiaceae bacterium]
ELDLDAIATLAVGRTTPRPFVEAFALKNGRTVRILAEGRLINLAAGEGHPAAVMDMSFANQALAAGYLAQHHRELEKKVYSVPDKIDQEVAELKLRALKIGIDTPTSEQVKYMASWSEGT